MPGAVTNDQTHRDACRRQHGDDPQRAVGAHPQLRGQIAPQHALQQRGNLHRHDQDQAAGDTYQDGRHRQDQHCSGARMEHGNVLVKVLEHYFAFVSGDRRCKWC
ncbi:hypothetical protein V6S19_05310 [Klebsiella pneumoniae]